jgi:hypothetical protein
LGGQDIALRRSSAPVLHRVFADRHAGSGIIGNQAFFDVHLLQRPRIGILAQRIAVPEQRPLASASTLGFPECVAPILNTVKLVQRVDLCEPR